MNAINAKLRVVLIPAGEETHESAHASCSSLELMTEAMTVGNKLSQSCQRREADAALVHLQYPRVASHDTFAVVVGQLLYPKVTNNDALVGAVWQLLESVDGQRDFRRPLLVA